MDRRSFELGRATRSRTYLAIIPGDLLNIIIDCSAKTPKRYKTLARNLTYRICHGELAVESVLEELVTAKLERHVVDYLQQYNAASEFWNEVFARSEWQGLASMPDSEPAVVHLCRIMHGANAEKYISAFAAKYNMRVSTPDSSDDEDGFVGYGHH